MNQETKKCQACEGGIARMNTEMAKTYLDQVQDWTLFEQDGLKIKRDFKFKNFKEAMRFVNHVADKAEQESHHPDIAIHYNQVEISLWTHAVEGLSENDFILAAKIDKLV